MEVEQAAEVSAPETADLKVPDKTTVRKHVPGDDDEIMLSDTNAHLFTEQQESSWFPYDVPFKSFTYHT